MYGIQLPIIALLTCTVLLATYSNASEQLTETKTIFIQTFNEKYTRDTTIETVKQMLTVNGANCLEKRINFASQLEKFAELSSLELFVQYNENYLNVNKEIQTNDGKTLAGLMAINCNEANLALSLLNANARLFLKSNNELIAIQ